MKRIGRRLIQEAIVVLGEAVFFLGGVGQQHKLIPISVSINTSRMKPMFKAQHSQRLVNIPKYWPEYLQNTQKATFSYEF